MWTKFIVVNESDDLYIFIIKTMAMGRIEHLLMQKNNNLSLIKA
jgi:hypothetical protein